METDNGTLKLLAGVAGYVLLYFGILWLFVLGMSHPRTAWTIAAVVLVCVVAVADYFSKPRIHSSPPTN